MSAKFTGIVTPAKWRLTLFALALTLLGGAALAIVLALGAADPPHAPQLALNLRSEDGLMDAGSFKGARLIAFPLDLTLPFTVEVEASNAGATGSAWGIWLRAVDTGDTTRDLPMLIDQNGYVIAALNTPTFQHVQFIHVESGSNRLYLNVDQNGTAIFRINDEIFATVQIADVQSAGLALYGDTVLDWKSIKSYMSD